MPNQSMLGKSLINIINARAEAPHLFNQQFQKAKEKFGARLEIFELKALVDQLQNPAYLNDLFPKDEGNAPIVARYLDQVIANLNTIVMVVDNQYITDANDGTDCVIISSKALKDRKVSNDPNYGICPHMTCSNQRSSKSIGTGFFVETGIIASAAHVLVGDHVQFNSLRFIQGVCMWSVDYYKNEIKIHKSKIFKPKENRSAPNDFYLSRMSSDWAIVEVEQAYTMFVAPAIRPVSIPDMNQYAAHMNSGNIVNKGVYSMGHGLGLPLKLSYTGKISDKSRNGSVNRAFADAPYFECSLSLLGGSSGSPVFDAITHELIGIYIRGTQKLKLEVCGDGLKWLVIKEEGIDDEGQECQRLEPVIEAVRKLRPPVKQTRQTY